MIAMIYKTFIEIINYEINWYYEVIFEKVISGKSVIITIIK